MCFFCRMWVLWASAFLPEAYNLGTQKKTLFYSTVLRYLVFILVFFNQAARHFYSEDPEIVLGKICKTFIRAYLTFKGTLEKGSL